MTTRKRTARTPATPSPFPWDQGSGVRVYHGSEGPACASIGYRADKHMALAECFLPDEQDIANLNLMLYAPDLLQACQRALPWLAWLIAEGRYQDCAMPHDAEATLALTRAAIARATEGQ